MNWLTAHPLDAAGLWIVFASVVDSMPPLPQDANYWLTWLHNALQAASLNFSRIQRIPIQPAGPAKSNQE